MTGKTVKKGAQEDSKPEAQDEQVTTPASGIATQDIEVFEKAVGPVRRVIIPPRPDLRFGQPEQIGQVGPAGPVRIPVKPPIPPGQPAEVKPEPPPPPKKEKQDQGGASG